ncbi:MAG: hypothetical protein HYT76_08205 [Deltaproteobacteria bacterium]|nr:hypothetical protein [Deltaproteobacteria bacterium]
MSEKKLGASFQIEDMVNGDVATNLRSVGNDGLGTTLSIPWLVGWGEEFQLDEGKGETLIFCGHIIDGNSFWLLVFWQFFGSVFE